MYSQNSRISMACILLVASGGLFQTAAGDIAANKALVIRAWEEVFNQRNLVAADELFAGDYVLHSPAQPDGYGPEAIKTAVAMQLAGTPDFHITVDDAIAEGDKVVTRWTFAGTHTGEIMGIPPTGNQVTMTGILTTRITDDKVVEDWGMSDQLGMMEQFGAAPPTREVYTWGTPSTVTGGPGDPESYKSNVQRMIDEIMNQQNLAVIDELFATDYVMHDPAWPMEVKGPEGFKQWAGVMLEPFFSDSEGTVDDMTAEVDKVAVRWIWSGTHTGEFMGIPPTGRRITVAGTSIHRFADGRFVESWASYDSLGMMQQLTTPEWPIAGAWISTVPVPDLGNIVGEWTVSPQSLDGTSFTSVTRPAKPEATVFGTFPDADHQSDHIGQTVKTGLNTYESTLVGYGTKKADLPGVLPQIVYISAIYSKVQLIDENTVVGGGTHAFFLPSADADSDGLPDDGQEPIACLPYKITAKRVGLMLPCAPPPLEPGGE